MSRIQSQAPSLKFGGQSVSDPDKWAELGETLTLLTKVMEQQLEMIQMQAKQIEMLAEGNQMLAEAIFGDEPEQADETEQPGVDMSGKRITLS